MVRLRVKIILLIFYAVAVLASCIRLAPQTAPDLPPAFIERAVLCADVVRTDDWAEPEDEKIAFSARTDAAVCSFLVFGPLSGGHRLTWKWYGPDGRLVRLSEPAEVGREGMDYDRYIAWDRLPLSAEIVEGRWRVVFFIDGETAGSREFELTK